MAEGKHSQPTGSEAKTWHEAVISGDGKLMAQLLEVYPRLIEKTDAVGKTALHVAAARGYDEIVAQLLAAKASVHAYDHQRCSALHCAVISGHCKVVAQLLAAGSRASTSTKDDSTALHSAARHGHDGVLAQLLADPLTANNIHNRGWTALHYAACTNNLQLVERLLADSRTRINAKDFDGHTALHRAVEARAANAVALLLTQDSIEVENGKSLRAAIVNHDDKSLTDDGIALQLIDRFPVDDVVRWVRETDRFGRSSFELAVDRGCDKVVHRLLDLSPSLVDIPAWNIYNFLQIAVTRGHEKLIDTFLALKPEWISSVARSGNTLLHLATISFRFPPQSFAKLWPLLKDVVRAKNKRGKNSFVIALAQSKREAIELMQWELASDEIMDAASLAKVKAKRFRPVIEKACACLLTLLNRDVLGIVFDYLLEIKRR